MMVVVRGQRCGGFGVVGCNEILKPIIHRTPTIHYILLKLFLRLSLRHFVTQYQQRKGWRHCGMAHGVAAAASDERR
jgi:hypothetical protein